MIYIKRTTPTMEHIFIDKDGEPMEFKGHIEAMKYLRSIGWTIEEIDEQVTLVNSASVKPLSIGTIKRKRQ